MSCIKQSNLLLSIIPFLSDFYNDLKWCYSPLMIDFEITLFYFSQVCMTMP